MEDGLQERVTLGQGNPENSDLTHNALRLRPVDLPQDLFLALPWYQDPEVLCFSEGEGTAPYDLETIERMYSNLSSRGECYIVEVRDEDGWHAIGDASLLPDGVPIVIGEHRLRGKGLGKRILALLVDRARRLGWKSIRVGKVFDYNDRARRLYVRAGFTETARGIDTFGRRFVALELQLDR